MPATLILPVENQVRELDAKLLLACVAAERGWSVVLGSRTFVNFAMPDLPRGVFVAKSMRSISKRTMGIIHDLGHRIVAWDEESLVRYSSPEYYAWRYSRDTFEFIDELFAWGPDDAAFFRSYEGYAGEPVHVTGNPRVDLLRPEVRGYFDRDVQALKARYGDFILVNTNFSFVNNFVPSLNLIERGSTPGQDRVSRTGRGMSLPFAAGMAAHQQAIYDHFRELMPKLASWFPGQRVVLRPHPSENHEVWRQVLAGCPQIEVVHEGNVVPWLLAAKVLLHNGCTTAVEATVLDTPAVSFMPVTSEVYDYHLPNGLSHQAHTPEAVHERLAAIMSGREGPLRGELRERLLARHLAATDGALACDRVLDALRVNGYALGPPGLPPARRWLRGWLASRYRTVKKRFNSLIPHHRNGAAYHAHRFPGVTAEALNERIARFGERLGRFASVRAEARSPHVFGIRDLGAATRVAADCAAAADPPGATRVAIEGVAP